jgi:short-subunit dehydrogenase
MRPTKYLAALGIASVSAVGAMLAIRFRRLSLRGRTALVTGGSRGLGLLIAEELASRGARVVITARDAAELERARARLQSRGAQIFAVVADLERRSDVEMLITTAREVAGDVDVLVNNAGVIEVGPASEMTEDSYARAMSVHFWAPLYLMRELAPAMRAKKSGRIVNISSIGGLVSVPHLLPYCASKFALRALSEGMHAELARDGVTVTTVCPGLMRTGSTRHALFRGQREKEHALFCAMSALPVFSMSAKRAASKIVAAALRGRAHLILTWQAKLAARAYGLAPGLATRVLAWTNRLLPLPAPGRLGPTPGHAIESKLLPSWVHAINERAAARYNE